MSDLVLAILKIIILLPLVLILAFVTLKYGLGKAQGYMGYSGVMKLVDRMTIGNKQGLCVVKILERYYLFSTTEKEVTLIKEFEAYPELEGIAVEDWSKNYNVLKGKFKGIVGKREKGK